MKTWWMGLAACALMLAPGLTTAGDDARPPTMQARMLLTGSVVVKPDGTVQRIAVEQVDLYTRGTPGQLKRWHHAFAAATLDAIRRWKFDVPTAGPSAGRSHWEARIPVVFSPTRQRRVAYGHWKSYLPGPEQFIPWADKNLIAQGGADAVPADGGLYPAQQTLHLLSSPGAH